MNKLVVAICVFFVAVWVVEAQLCRYKHSSQICSGLTDQCCGKVGHKSCSDSCEDYSCSSNADCGRSCCENGKCGPPNSKVCVKKNPESEILAIVISLVVITAIIIVAVVVSYVCCCRRKTPAPDMVMIVNTGVYE